MANTNIKQIIKQEYIKCAKDPVYFMRKYCYIQHPQRGRILFNLYPFQEKVLSLFKDNKKKVKDVQDQANEVSKKKAVTKKKIKDQNKKISKTKSKVKSTKSAKNTVDSFEKKYRKSK